MRGLVEDLPVAIPDHRLLRVIGRGSYGEVWLAENIMGAGRAVKIVRRDTFASARPYEREYSAIRRYEPVSRKADGLVQVLHAGRLDEEGLFYYVMELADACPWEGSSLDEDIHASYEPRTLTSDLKRLGRLPAGDCVSIALSLAGALASLHSAGLAHRDVKPSNIIFVNGRAKLADIGLVSELGDSRSFVGTEGYIPPEGPGTPSADLFSLGRVLYETVTGLDQSRYPELPPDWIERDEPGVMEFFEVVLKACEGDPARRYQNGADMMADLALLQGGRSVRRVRLLEARVVALKRWGFAALALLALAAAGVALAQWRAKEERSLRENQAALLYDQAIAGARATVHSERPDARQAILNSARLAARARPGMREPRDAAIAALARPGLVPVKELRDTSTRSNGTGGPAFSADFTLMTEVDADRRVQIRRVSDNALVTQLPEPLMQNWVNVLFSRDARWVCGQLSPEAMRFWNLADPSKSFTLQRPDALCYCRSFSPDNKRVAIVWSNGMASVHELHPEKVICEFRLLPENTGPFRPLAVWSPDGGRLAAGARHYVTAADGKTVQAGIVKVHDAATGEGLHEVELDAGLVDFDWCPQGGWLALAMSDGGIRRWPVTYERAEKWLTHDGAATCVNFHPSGEWLVTSSWDSTTLIWNVAGQHPLMRLNGWGDISNFSADGSLLLHHDAGRRLRTFYEFQSSSVCRQLTLTRPREHNPSQSPLLDLDLHDGGWLVAAGYDGLWISQSPGRPAPRLSGLEGQCVRIVGDRLWAGTPDGLVAYPFPPVAETKNPEPFAARGIKVDHLDVSADGTSAVLCSNTSQVFVWRDETLTPLPSGIGFAHVAISPDGRWAAAGGREDALRVWDLETMRRAADFHGEGAWVHVAFSPDSRMLVAGDGASLRAFTAPDFLLAWKTPHLDPGGFSVRPAFSPLGDLIAATLEMRQPWLLRAATGERLARLDHPFAQGVNLLSFSPDGQTLATLGTRNSIFLWDLALLRSELDAMGLVW